MRKHILAGVVVMAAGGCGGPSVVYHIDDPALQKAPPVGSVSFALRTTNITISAVSTTSAQTPQTGIGGNGNNNNTTRNTGGSGGHGGNNTATPAAAAQDTTQTAAALKTAEVCESLKDSENWRNCFWPKDGAPKIGFVVTPDVSADHVYTAVPDNDLLQLHQTTLSETAKGDPLMPSSVTVRYNDRTKDVVTSVGTGIVSGAPFGPYGMALGGLTGLFNGVTAGPGTTEKARSTWETQAVQPALSNFICTPAVGTDAASLNWQTVDDTRTLQLKLPIAVPLDETLRPGGSDHSGGPIDPGTQTNKPTPDGRQCWNLLPQYADKFNFMTSDQDDRLPPFRGDGWLYQIVLNPIDAKNTVPASSYFAPSDAGGSVTAAKSDFPASACRKGHLHILWWRELNQYLFNKSLGSQNASYTYLSVPVEVADPTTVVTAPLPHAGDIVFNDVCGAHTAPAADNNPGPGDVTKEVFKQIKAVKDSQKSTSSTSTKTTN